MFLPQYKKPSVKPIHNSHTILLYILVLVFFDSKLEDKRYCTD
jgi:hypothetical protein